MIHNYLKSLGYEGSNTYSTDHTYISLRDPSNRILHMTKKLPLDNHKELDLVEFMEHAKNRLKKSMELNNQYTIVAHKSHIEVGCEIIGLGKIREIVSFLTENYNL